MKSLFWSLGVWVWALCAASAETACIAYAFPSELPKSAVYQVAVDGVPVPALQTQRGAILSFGMKRELDLAVKLGRKPQKVVVRPLSSGVVAELQEDGFRFRLPRPMNLSVEIDGNIDDPLFVFANPELQAPAKDDPKVRYFEGGKIHDAGEILLKSGETLYLEGGAVVRGVVRAVSADKVAVRGPGMLDGGPRQHKTNMLVVRECHNALLEDFILLDPLGWSIHLSGSNQITMRNTRVVGWRANSDGVDVEYSKHVTIDGCFWRTNDDCIAIKAIYPPGVKGVPFEEMIDPECIGGHAVERIPGDSMGDIEIRNCVLWNDAAGQGFEIGFELRIDEVKGVHFHDSDIIRVIGGGAFTIHNGDQAAIRDLLIENVRIEETDRLVDFHVGLSIYSVDCPREYHRSTPKPQRKAPPRRPERANNPWQWYIPDADKMAHHETFRGFIEGVTLRNVNLVTPPLSASIMNGFSEAKGISKVRYENVTVQGKPIDSIQAARIEANEFVKGIEFVKP